MNPIAVSLLRVANLNRRVCGGSQRTQRGEGASSLIAGAPMVGFSLAKSPNAYGAVGVGLQSWSKAATRSAAIAGASRDSI